MSKDLEFQAIEEGQVDYVTASKPYMSLVQDENGDWVFREIGMVSRTNYDPNSRDSIRELAFTPNDRSKSYPMGIDHRNLSVIDHQPLLAPMLDEGWDVASIRTLRGGSKIAATFTHPEVTVADNITYDGLNDGRPQHVSIVVMAEPKKGLSYQLMGGLFRLVCTNGLVAKALDLGSIRGSGTARLTPESLSVKVRQFSNTVIAKAQGERPDYRLSTLTKSGIEWMTTLTTPREDGRAAPDFIRTNFESLTRHFTAQQMGEFGEQLHMFLDSTDDLTILVLLNMITNVRQDIRVASTLDSRLTAFRNLVEIGDYIRGA